MNKNDLTPFEQDLLKSMNKKAMMIIKAEEYLTASKITFNTELFDQMSEKQMEDFLETWNPDNQATLREKYVSDETNEDNQHKKNVFKLEDRLVLLAQLVRANHS